MKSTRLSGSLPAQVLLIGMSGFAIDLGWIYLNTTRTQKAVDSAALAGVVNLPGFITQANVDAADAARANGYDPGGADTLTVTPLADNKLHAELHEYLKPALDRFEAMESDDD